MTFKNSNLSPIRWILWFLLTSITLIGITFTISFIVDPFGNRNWIVNKKYKPAVHERSEKYNTIFYQHNFKKYNCVILGSSRVMSIIPDNNQSGEQCYNFGVHVANNPEKLFILDEWLKHAPLKTVYIGNELYNTHSKNLPLYLNKYKFTNGSEGNYLSISTFFMSIKALRNTIKDESQTYFETDGYIRYSGNERSINEGTFDHSYQHFQEMAYGTIQHDYLDNAFTYESKALDPLKEIKKLCDRHHVQLYPFITPTFYEAQLAIINNPSLSIASEKFRKDLVDIFGTVYNFDINNSQNKNPENFYDVVHYRPAIGNLMINRMHTDNGYGTILNK
ncbi:MAG: hypothetical protein WCW84_13055 [Sulfurimonas sp.]|jgi:hypothetical protein